MWWCGGLRHGRALLLRQKITVKQCVSANVRVAKRSFDLGDLAVIRREPAHANFQLDRMMS
jgi:hypothetical protein